MQSVALQLLAPPLDILGTQSSLILARGLADETKQLQQKAAIEESTAAAVAGGQLQQQHNEQMQ